MATTFRLKRKLFMGEAVDYSSQQLMGKLNNVTNPRTAKKLKNYANYITEHQAETSLVKATPNVPAVVPKPAVPAVVPKPATPPPVPVSTTPKASSGFLGGIKNTWKSGAGGKVGLIASGAALLGTGLLAGKSLFGGKKEEERGINERSSI